jgi:hypothetical protein
MRNKKATRDDDVPGDVLKLLGEDGLRLMTQPINSMYVTGEWPGVLIEFTMIDLKKKPKATKFSDHRTISIIAHAAKIVVRDLEEGLKGTLRMLLEISLDLEEEKEPGMQLGC